MMTKVPQIPDDLWLKIFMHYLPEYQYYCLLFVCKKFYQIVRHLEKLTVKSQRRFKRKKYYFLIRYGFYYYGDSNYFSKVNQVESQLLPNGWRVNCATKFQTAAKFVFTSTRKDEILLFFQKYCMPIHCIVLENVQTYPNELGEIISKCFRYKIPSTLNVMENRIIWRLEQDSPIRNLRPTFFYITKIYFYNCEISCAEYLEIHERINSLSRLLASSHTMMYVLKCFKNICIVDVIFSYNESIIPSISFK